ncbi:MAG TPA: DUF5711 family protein [Clostridia bacterium]|nr:DUF5711 family protein [Clostridia bacterium]
MRQKRFKQEGKGKYLAFLVSAAVIITCFTYPYFYSALLRTEFNPNNLFRVSNFEGHPEARQGFAVLSGSLVSLQGTTLKLQAGDGRTLWQKELNLQEPFIAAFGETIVAADMKSGEIYGLDRMGRNLWNTKPAGGIIRMGVDKEHVWMRTRHEELAIVEVLDKDGKETAYLQVGEAEVTGVSASRDGSLIALSAAGVKEGSITGSVVLYRRDGAIVWAKTYRDSLVMGIKITNDGDVLVLTETALFSLSAGGDINWQRNITGYILRALFTDDGTVALTLAGDYRSQIPGKTEQETVLYDKKGNDLGRVAHDGEIIGLAEGQGCIGMYSARKLQVVPINGGDIIDKKFDRDLMAVYLLEDSFMAYISAGKIYFEPVAG